MDTLITPSPILVARVIELEKGGPDSGSVETLKIEHPPTAIEGWYVVTGVYWNAGVEYKILGTIDPDGTLDYAIHEKKADDYDPFKGLEL